LLRFLILLIISCVSCTLPAFAHHSFDQNIATNVYLKQHASMCAIRGCSGEPNKFWFMAQYVFSAFALTYFVWSGLATKAQKSIQAKTGKTWLQYIALSLIISVLWSISMWPLKFYDERFYERLSVSAVLGEYVAIFGLVALALVLCRFVIGLLGLRSWIVPALIVAVYFFTLSLPGQNAVIRPMPSGPTKDAINKMAAPHSIHPNNLNQGWVNGMSLSSEGARAWGFFPQNRNITFSETLFPNNIEGYHGGQSLSVASEEVVIAIAGHEIAHHANNDIFWLTFFSCLFGGITSGLSVLIAMKTIKNYGYKAKIESTKSIACYPFYISSVILALVVVQIPINFVVRQTELRADLDGYAISKAPDGFAEAMLRLHIDKPLFGDPVEEFLFNSHPNGRDRIYNAMVWKSSYLKRRELLKNARK
jgi:hypothetical protein